jgi:hypothetical protein
VRRRTGWVAAVYMASSRLPNNLFYSEQVRDCICTFHSAFLWHVDLAPVSRIPWLKPSCRLPSLSGGPILLERHGADVVQCRMKSAGIVKAKPVDDFIHRSTPHRKVPTVQSCHLQRTPQAFGRRIDAPMSSSSRRIGEIGQNERIQVTDDIAFQAAVDFLVRHAFLRPTINIGPSAWIAAHPNHGNGP